MKRNYQESINNVSDGIINEGSNTASRIGMYIPDAEYEPLRISGWVEMMRAECELVDAFLKGDRKYWHTELLGLYLSMLLGNIFSLLWSCPNYMSLLGRPIQHVGKP